MMRILNILVRRCVPLDQFDTTVAAYEKLVGQQARLSFAYPEQSLKLAQVASLLFIGGDTASLRPFVATDATFLVEDIEQWQHHLVTVGAQVIAPVKTVPTGHNMLVRHADGMLVEYVEHTIKHPDDILPGRST